MEPPPSTWDLPSPLAAPTPDEELVGIGGDVEPGTILSAYRKGLVPLPLPKQLAREVGNDVYPVGWWSPNPRGIIPLDGIKITKSLRRSMRSYTIRINTAFEDVLRAAADPSREHGWITDDFFSMYMELHRLGWAHSVETWGRDDNVLSGGLIGIAIGGYFSGDTMFHHRRDGSKIALVGLVERLKALDYRLLDVQWPTAHLQSLGAICIPRLEYLELLASAIELCREPLGFGE